MTITASRGRVVPFTRKRGREGIDDLDSYSLSFSFYCVLFSI
jgi:hypothetical protein